jgi:hypothetical protein
MQKIHNRPRQKQQKINLLPFPTYFSHPFGKTGSHLLFMHSHFPRSAGAPQPNLPLEELSQKPRQLTPVQSGFSPTGTQFIALQHSLGTHSALALHSIGIGSGSSTLNKIPAKTIAATKTIAMITYTEICPFFTKLVRIIL